MNKESRQEKKRLEKRLKVVKTRITKLEQEQSDLLQSIFLLKGECYRCWYTYHHHGYSKSEACHCGAVTGGQQ
jgi:predicted nuclease with TOPRIM domain